MTGRQMVSYTIQYTKIADKFFKAHEDVREDYKAAIKELLVDVCTTARPTIRISGEEKPAAVVISRLKKLNSSHIGYVMDCLQGNTTKITSIRQYLLAVLYNAPITMEHYYTALVHHDMAGGLV